MKKYKHLTLEQRYAIYLGLKSHRTYSSIAQEIGVSVSTVWREVKRNSNKHGHYCYLQADEIAKLRKEVFNRYRISRFIIAEVISLLRKEQWSPKQISNWLKINKGIRISHETIYKLIREDKKQGGNLWTYCRHKMRYRKKIKKPHTTKATNIPNRTSIHLRPQEVNGERFGDWEMDFIVGKKGKDRILTLCEKSTNFLIMKRIKSYKPKDIAMEIIYALLPYKDKVLTITTDNGIEFREHALISKRIDTSIYFTDSYCSWQKGQIENTNKLIRQYIAKGIDFDSLTDNEIEQIQFKINRRPRKKLQFKTPKELFFKNLMC